MYFGNDMKIFKSGSPNFKFEEYSWRNGCRKGEMLFEI